jgi:hypothetical protein
VALTCRLCNRPVCVCVCEGTPLKRHSAEPEVQHSHQHALSIIQGNLPCVASEIRFGLAHRSVGSSRNGLSAPRAAAIDPRKPGMTNLSRELTWICARPPPPPGRCQFILNVCYCEAAGEYEICALEH